jgi:RHS repeat-associated protein
MDRIFETSKVTQICDDLNKILKESESYMESLKTISNNAQEAANAVPADTREASITTASSGASSAADGTDFETILSNLETCKEASGSLIPDADTAYGEQTRELVTQVKNIQTVIKQIKNFLVDTPLTVNYRDFMASMDVASKKWSSMMEDTVLAVNKLLMNMKGEEVKSVWYSKDPVNLSTGNFVYDRTDLVVKGEEPFVFRRVYNSVNHRMSVLGRDWNHNYEIFLETDGTEKVISFEDGKEERFLETSTGVYTSIYQNTGTLNQIEHGYEYITREQQKYFFDLEGYCSRKETLKGGGVNLSYEADEETGGKRLLRKIEKDSGECFFLDYNAKGYLHSVTDHTGRQITFEMQKDQLTGVSTPNGGWYRYGYTPEGKLESVENPEGVLTIENTFDEQMRTIKQCFPDGGIMLYAYDDEKQEVELTERNGSKIIYVHDESFRDVKHIYSDGEERFEYNKRNQRTVFIDKLGNKTQYAYDEHGNRTRVINALGTEIHLEYGAKNQLHSVEVDGKQKVRNRYDEKGNLIETQDAEGNTYQFFYKEAERTKEIRQPDGGVVVLEQDSRGNITCLTDPNGVTYRFTYDELNQVIEIIDGNGNHTLYSYDKNGNIKEVTNANGSTRKYTYNANNKVIRIEDFDGSVIQREYNVLNKPSKVTDQMGRSTILTYDAMWNLAKVTQPNGAKTTFIYNEHNHLSRIRNANGDVVRYTYDAAGNRIGITNELGYQTTLAYDALGRLIKVTSPEGDCSVYTYNAEGQIVKVQDTLGNEAHMEYDGNGKLIKETNPLGESRNYTYTSMGQVESITNEVGQKTIYTYEKGGRLVKITYPEGGQASYTHDGNGNIKTYTNPKGYMMTYTYDALDQVVKIEGRKNKESEKEVKTYIYDCMGNVTSMTDARGAITHYEYSLTGKLTKVIDPIGNETVYQYDDCDRLLKIYQYGEEADQDSEKDLVKGLDKDLQGVQIENRQNRKNNRITSYEYDLLGQVTKVTDSLGHSETYEYDKAGQLLAKFDKDGYLTRYGYTPSGLMNHIQYADGKEVKLSYNPIRQLEEIKDWLGITRMEHDALGRIKKVDYPDGKEVSYTYGCRGERTGITYPDGEKVIYEYDKYSRLSRLKQGGESITYEYDAAGFLTKKRFPNGIESTYDYNEVGQINTLIHRDAAGILDEYHYGYDRTGNRTSVIKHRRELPEESGVYEYEYDLLGRLIDVRKDEVKQKSYTYDAFGNRSSMTADGVESHYQYNTENQLISRIDHLGELTYTYDKRGNLSQVFEKGNLKNSYIFGSTNQLEEMTQADGEIVQYLYNGMGHRVGKSVSNTLTGIVPKPEMRCKEVEYLIDFTRQYHNLLQKTEDGKRQIYLWDKNVLGLLDGADTEVSLERNQVDQTAQYYYLQDEQGSPIRLLYHNGDIKESYGYDVFGEELYQQLKSQPFGYTGYQQDKESQMYFAQARYYKPEIGRFLSEDMIQGFKSAPLSMNRYTYCYNHPVGLADRDGMWPSLEDIEDAFSDWGDTIADGVDTIAEAVQKPIGDLCSQVVKWGNAHPQIRDMILNALKLGIRPIFNDSLGIKIFTYATQMGYADEFLEAFDFHRDDAGIFHTSQDCWQQYLGYNDVYDWGFKVGTDAERNKFPVTSNGEEYCIWMWKGDYVNLGAGAETGIYKKGEPHWEVSVDDALPMMLALYDKAGNTILVYDPADPQWWITGFDPMIQGEDAGAGNLTVIGSIDLSSNTDLWDALKDRYAKNKSFCFDEENHTLYYNW